MWADQAWEVGKWSYFVPHRAGFWWKEWENPVATVPYLVSGSGRGGKGIPRGGGSGRNSERDWGWFNSPYLKRTLTS
jgi:hypothetical protein